MTSKKNSKKIVFFFLFFLLIIFSTIAIYLKTYYHADIINIENFNPTTSVTKIKLTENAILYSSEKITTDIGFIFYPGGKVEHLSYEPLLKSLAANGIHCILVKMPCNLAIFDINAAKEIQEKLPSIKKWFIGGHSLGGSAAAMHVEKNSDKFSGLILLGSYSTVNLSQKSLKIVSIYGSNDLVLNKKNYLDNKKNLPSNFQENIIQGGNHAYFGMYGFQKGDGKASISNIEQIEKTKEIIMNFVNQ